MQTSSGPVGSAGTIVDEDYPVHGRRCAVDPNSCVPRYNFAKLEESGSDGGHNRRSASGDHMGRNTRNDHPAGVGLRGLQGLCIAPGSTKLGQSGSTQLPRRPSSAPARRHRGSVACENKHWLTWQRQTTAINAVIPTGNREPSCQIFPLAPGTWGAEEQEELRDGLVRCVWYYCCCKHVYSWRKVDPNIVQRM